MAQTLAIVVGAEIHDSHRQYRGLLSQGIVAESCFRLRRSATEAAADLAQATFVKVDCAGCHHVALLMQEVLS